jgi:hypothetical protein
MAETPQGSNNAGNVIGWLEKLFALIKKSGIQNIILTIMMLFLVIVVGQVAFHPESFIKKIETIQQEQHQKSINKRIESTPKIREAMLDFRSEINADRVFVMEAHNGGQNLDNLPFLYVDLTYAEPKASTSWLLDEYINVRLSRYPCATILFEETYILMSIEQIKTVDPELYYRLDKDNVKFLCMMILYNGKAAIGAIGATYTDITHVPNNKELKKSLVKYGHIITEMISND